ncbi:MAG: TetR/AcrR family transcriptional regulator [Atopobiaceae bacterium]|nr:TetR/AcrR family transcriptional regulator [Atopobiaceae bacterium]
MAANAVVNRRVRMTRAMVRDALLELLDEKALGDISVTELCARADINRTTFYKHYGTPDDVLQDIAEGLAEGAAAAAQVGSEPLPLGDQVAAICRHLRDHPREASAVLVHFGGDSQVVRGMMGARLSSGQVRMPAYARRCDADTAKLLGAFLANGIYSLVRCWMLEGVDKTPEEIGALAEDIAVHGWIDG